MVTIIDGYSYEVSKCPFCPGKPVVKGRKRKWVECRACGATGPRLPFVSDAIAAWNNREELVEDGAKKQA